MFPLSLPHMQAHAQHYISEIKANWACVILAWVTQVISSHL